jgi:hypothetical protein
MSVESIVSQTAANTDTPHTKYKKAPLRHMEIHRNFPLPLPQLV